MKDHKKKTKEIQERAIRETEEKQRKTEQETLEKENKKFNTLSKIKMTTPTPQDFYNLQEKFTQMQQMMSQLSNNSQLSSKPP